MVQGAIRIGLNNTAQVGLRSGGTLTAGTFGGITDSPADRLLVRGVTDVLDTDTTPRELFLAANVLDFFSGGDGGATTLYTFVSRINATHGGDEGLTIIEVGQPDARRHRRRGR